MLQFRSGVRLQLALELVHGVLPAQRRHEEPSDLGNGRRVVDNVQRLGVDTYPEGMTELGWKSLGYDCRYLVMGNLSIKLNLHTPSVRGASSIDYYRALIIS